MRVLRSVCIPVAFVFAAAICGAQENGNDFHWTGHLSDGQTLQIKNISGDIDVTGVSGDQIEVSATKSGRDADQVHIEVVKSGDGVTICSVYAGGDNNCEAGEGFHSHTHDVRAKVEYTVRLPKNIKLDARNVNGGVTARDLGSNAKVSSVNGSVHVSTAGFAEASSVNGSVEADMGRADWTGTLAVKSVNGSLHLTMPSNMNTEVNFESVNGRLDTDFPLTVQGSMSSHRLHGTIGSGERQLEVKTVNGNVELRKASL